MKVLVTGAAGFVGKNLTEALKNLRDGKDRTRPTLQITEIYEYDRDSYEEDLKNSALINSNEKSSNEKGFHLVLLEQCCRDADFIFHLAGVNRPRDASEFTEGNCGFLANLLDILKKCGNTCPVMLSGSIQASLSGRYAESEYGRSKLAGEKLLFQYGEETGARVLIYRFPNLFGKWCRPNYNSVVATFCHNIAHDLPITVNNPDTELELLYIDDLIETLLDALEGKFLRCRYEEYGTDPIPDENGPYCYAPVTYHIRLGEIVKFLEQFRQQPDTLMMPRISNQSFAKKLYSTYLSYLPEEKMVIPLEMHEDARGSFTEIFKSVDCGQFSDNISKPGITKGQHWHHSKWEFFIVVSGHGLIQERKVGTDEVLEFEVSGDKMEAVHMLPGYTHNLINLSDTENLVTVMWANEIFDPEKPDTYYEEV